MLNGFTQVPFNRNLQDNRALTTGISNSSSKLSDILERNVWQIFNEITQVSKKWLTLFVTVLLFIIWNTSRNRTSDLSTFGHPTMTKPAAGETITGSWRNAEWTRIGQPIAPVTERTKWRRTSGILGRKAWWTGRATERWRLVNRSFESGVIESFFGSLLGPEDVFAVLLVVS